MIVANVIASLSTLVIALLFFMDALMLWQLYVTLSINSIANAFTSPPPPNTSASCIWRMEPHPPAISRLAGTVGDHALS